MAFNLVARLKLQGPANVRQIVNRIQSQLQSVSVNVALNIPSGTNTALTNFNKSLSSTNVHLKDITASANAASTALAAVKTSVSGAQQKINKVAQSTQQTSRNMLATANASELAATEIGEFGRISALALRRFVGFSLTAGIMIGMVVQIRQGIKAAIDFEREIVRVQQVTGKTVSGLRSLTDAIGDMSTAYGVSSNELAEVTRILSQAGLAAKDTQAAMSAIAKSDLSPTFENMKQTTEGVIAAMRQFKIQGKDIESALGSINAVASSFAVESSDIISAIRRTGGAFKAAGGDLNELIALFTSVRATTRESADSIATGFRTIFTRMQRPRTIQFLKEFGIELQNTEGHFVGPYNAVRKLHMALKDLDPRDIRFSRIIEELGGFRQVSKAIPLIQQFTIAQQAMIASLAGSESVTEDAEIAQRALAVQIGQVAEEYKKLFREIGDSKLFKSLAEYALKFADNLTDVVRQLSPLMPLLGALGVIQGGRMVGRFGRGFSQGLFPVARKESEALQQQVVAVQQQNTQALEKNTVSQQTETTTAKVYADALRLNNVELSKLTSSIVLLNKTITMMPGFARKMATGGSVPGAGNQDTVPAMLTPGEFVINKNAARSFGYNNLRDINQMSSGGRVIGSSVSGRGMGSSVLGRTLLSGKKPGVSATVIAPSNIARSALGMAHGDKNGFWKRLTEIHGMNKIRYNKDRIQMMLDDIRRYPHQSIKPSLYGLHNIFGHETIAPREFRPPDYSAFRDPENVMYDPSLQHVLGFARGGMVPDPRIRLAYKYAKQYKKKFGLKQEMDRLPHIREFDKDDYMDEASAYGYFRNTNVHDMRRLMTSRRGFNQPRGEIALNLQLIKNNAKLKDTVFHELSHRADAQAGGNLGYASDRSGDMWHLWITKNKQRLFDALTKHLARRMMLPYIQGKSDNDLIQTFASNPNELIAGIGSRSFYDALPSTADKVDFIKKSIYKSMSLQAGRFLSDQPDSEYFARMMAGSSPDLRRLRRDFLSKDIFGGENVAPQAKAEQVRIAKIMEGRGKIQGYARGGVVPGVGSGDTVPALLESGEFVIQKSAVDAFGVENLRRINKYAQGDIVRPDGLRMPPNMPPIAAHGLPYSVAKPIADKYAVQSGSAAHWGRMSAATPNTQYARSPIPVNAGQEVASSGNAGQAAQQAMFMTMMLGNFASTMVDADSAAQKWIQSATTMIITFNAMRMSLGVVQGLTSQLSNFAKTGAQAGVASTHLRGMFSPKSVMGSPHAFRQVATPMGMGVKSLTRYGHVDALSKNLTGLNLAALGTASAIAALSGILIYLGEQSRKESHEMAKDARTSAQMQDAIDKRRTGRGLSSAGWGAAAGGGIGFIVGSIFPVIGNAVGAAVGAGIGGALGGLYGMFGSMEAEIKELRKINRESRVQESSDDIRNALDRLAAGNVDARGSKELLTLGKSLESLRAAQFQAEADKDTDAALSITRELRGMAPQVQVVKDELISSAASLDDFENRTSAGAQIITYMASQKTSSTYAIRQEIQKEITERNKARASMEKETRARERAVSLITTLNQFNAAMTETVQRLQRAGDALDGIAGLARGDVVMPEFKGMPGFGNFASITEGGVFDIKQFEDALRQVGGGFGSTSDNYMLNSTLDIARTIDKLPQVIRNVVAGGATALSPEQLSGQFQDEFENLLGTKDDTGKMQITRAQEMVMHTIMGGITDMIGKQGSEAGVGKLINQMRTDEAGVLRELGLKEFEPIFKQWDGIANSQTDAMQALDKAVKTRISLETDMTRKQLDLARQELSNRQEIFELTKQWPTDEFGAGRVRAARGNQISDVLQGTRVAGADPFDVELIGGALSRVNEEINELSQKRQTMKVVDDSNRKASFETTTQLGALNTEAQKLQMALGVLANTTDEATQIRQTLNRLEEEKKGQFGLLERYMFESDEGQQKILTSIYDALAVSYGGIDIQKLPDERRQALGSLSMGDFRNIRALMFGVDEQGQGLTGNIFNTNEALKFSNGVNMPAMLRPFLGATLGERAAEIAPGTITDEQKPLLDNLKRLHAEKHQAELANLALMKDEHTRFITLMGSEFTNFTKVLVDSFAKAEVDTLKREQFVLKSRIGDINKQKESVASIREMADSVGLNISDKAAMDIALIVSKKSDVIDNAKNRYSRAVSFDQLQSRYSITREGATPEDIIATGINPKRFMSTAYEAWQRAKESPEMDFATVLKTKMGDTNQDFLGKMDKEGLLSDDVIKNLRLAIAEKLQKYGDDYKAIQDEKYRAERHGQDDIYQKDDKGAYVFDNQYAKDLRERLDIAPREAFQEISAMISDALRKAANTDIAAMQSGTIGDDKNNFGVFRELLINNSKDILGLSSSLKELDNVKLERLNSNLANFTTRLEEINIELTKLGAVGGEAEAHATGGPIFRSRGTDTVPAMLTPGEFVVKRSAAQKNMELLRAINSGDTPMYAAQGGVVDRRAYWTKKREEEQAQRDRARARAMAIAFPDENQRREYADRAITNDSTQSKPISKEAYWANKRDEELAERERIRQRLRTRKPTPLNDIPSGRTPGEIYVNGKPYEQGSGKAALPTTPTAFSTITPEAFPAQPPIAEQPNIQISTPRYPPGTDARFRSRGYTPQKPLHQLRAESQARMETIHTQRAELEQDFEQDYTRNLEHRRQYNAATLEAKRKDNLMRIVGGDSVAQAQSRFDAMRSRIKSFDAQREALLYGSKKPVTATTPTTRGTGAYDANAKPPARTRQPLGFDRPPVETHTPKFESMADLQAHQMRRREAQNAEMLAGRSTDQRLRAEYDNRTRTMQRMNILAENGVISRDATPEEAAKAWEQLQRNIALKTDMHNMVQDFGHYIPRQNRQSATGLRDLILRYEPDFFDDTEVWKDIPAQLGVGTSASFMNMAQGIISNKLKSQGHEVSQKTIRDLLEAEYQQELLKEEQRKSKEYDQQAVIAHTQGKLNRRQRELLGSQPRELHHNLATNIGTHTSPTLSKEAHDLSLNSKYAERIRRNAHNVFELNREADIHAPVMRGRIQDLRKDTRMPQRNQGDMSPQLSPVGPLPIPSSREILPPGSIGGETLIGNTARSTQPINISDTAQAHFAEEMGRMVSERRPQTYDEVQRVMEEGRATMGQPKIYSEDVVREALNRRAALQDAYDRNKRSAFHSSREGYAKYKHTYTQKVADPNSLPTYDELYKQYGNPKLKTEINDIDDWIRSQELLKEEQRKRKAYQPNKMFEHVPWVTKKENLGQKLNTPDSIFDVANAQLQHIGESLNMQDFVFGVTVGNIPPEELKRTQEAYDLKKVAAVWMDAKKQIGLGDFLHKKHQQWVNGQITRKQFENGMRRFVGHELGHGIDNAMHVSDNQAIQSFLNNPAVLDAYSKSMSGGDGKPTAHSLRPKEILANIFSSHTSSLKPLQEQLFKIMRSEELLPKDAKTFHSGGLVSGSGNQPAVLQGGEFVLSRSVVQALAKGGVVQGYQDGGVAQSNTTSAGGSYSLLLADDAQSAMKNFTQEFTKTVNDFSDAAQRLEAFPDNFDGVVTRLEDSISTIPTEIKLDADLNALTSSLDDAISRWETATSGMPTEFSLNTADVNSMLSKFSSDFATNVGALQQTMSEFSASSEALPENISAAFGTANTGMIESANALSGAMSDFNSAATSFGQSATQLATVVAEFAVAADRMRGAAIEIRDALAQEVRISVTHTHQPVTVVVEGGETLTQSGDAFSEMVMGVVGPEIDRLRDRIRDTGFGIA